MASEIQKLGRHALVYGAGIAVGRLAGFLMLPIYTNFLTPSDYGTLELLIVTVDLLGTIAGAGVASAVYKFYTDAESEAEKKGLISTSAFTLMALVGTLTVVGLLASHLLAGLVLGNTAESGYFRIFFLIYFLQSAETVPLLYLRARHRSVAFALINVARLVLALTLNIYFLVVLGLGVIGVLYASLITAGVFAIALSVHMFRDTGVRFVRENARTLIGFGAPMILWTLSNFLIGFSDRYFLKAYGSDAAVGLYSFAFRFSMLIRAFGFKPFMLVWGPQRYEVARRADGIATIRRVFGYLNLVLGFVALVIILFAGEVIEIMANPTFHAAAGLVAPLVITQFLIHLVSFPNLSILTMERTKVLGSLAVLTGAIVIVLNFALIPRYGMYGAAFATLIASVLRFVVVLIVAQRIRRFEYGWARVALTYLILGVPIAIEILFPIESLVGSLALSTGLTLVAGVALYGFALEETERAWVRSIPSKIAARLGRGPAQA